MADLQGTLQTGGNTRKFNPHYCLGAQEFSPSGVETRLGKRTLLVRSHAAPKHSFDNGGGDAAAY